MVEKSHSHSEESVSEEKIFEFEMPHDSLALIKNELHLMKGNAEKMDDVSARYVPELYDSLTIPIQQDRDIPVFLSMKDVDFITRMLQVKRFGKSEQSRRRHTKSMHAIWDLNINFTDVSGEITENFKFYLNKNLHGKK